MSHNIAMQRLQRIKELEDRISELDSELNITHEALTTLYHFDCNVSIIKLHLDRIEKLRTNKIYKKNVT